ncbi:MAG: hypothetical protein GX154_00425 [Clostridiales bacterium]|jgi:hypothetical protein|nr:hypothetical protein [Clostridiales bacterium]
MKDTSKILLAISYFADKMEKAYQNSLFLKLCKKINEIWQHSTSGKIISGFFSYDMQNNSLFYKTVKSVVNRSARGIAGFFSVKEAISNSEYIKGVNRLFLNISFNKMHGIKTVFKNSFFINIIYEYWTTVD